MRVLLFDIFNGCSSSIKEINSLVSKGICILFVDVFNGCSFSSTKEINRLISKGMSNIYS